MNRTLACKVKTVQNESSCPSSPKPLPCLGNSADHWAWDNSGCWAGRMHSQRVSGSPSPGLLMNIGKSRDKRLQLFWTLVDKELSLRPEKSIEQMTCKSLFRPHDIWYVLELPALSLQGFGTWEVNEDHRTSNSNSKVLFPTETVSPIDILCAQVGSKITAIVPHCIGDLHSIAFSRQICSWFSSSITCGMYQNPRKVTQRKQDETKKHQPLTLKLEGFIEIDFLGWSWRCLQRRSFATGLEVLNFEPSNQVKYKSNIG